jgi:O-antigen/teichoic acid export membrane protein
MKSEDQHTIRSTGWLLIQRVAVVVAALLFALIVPRLMGAATYGKYALLGHFAVWLSLFGMWGSTYVVLRYAPEFVLKRARCDIQTFLGELCSFRLVCGGLTALLGMGACRVWFPEIPAKAVLLVAVLVFLRPQVRLFFGTLLAVNRPALWGMTHVLRGWGSLLFVPPLYVLAGLRGACAGLLLCEVLLFVVGAHWARAYIRRPVWRWRDVTPYLGFGLTFFWTDLLSAGATASGPIMIRVFTGDYAEVGFFGLAQSVFGLLLLSMLQLAMSATPRLTALRIRGDIDGIKRQVERLLESLSAVGMLLLLAVLLTARHFVPLVLGSEFRPVALNLMVMMATLVPLVLCSVGRMLCMVCERPRVAFFGECVGLVVYWSVGCLLTPHLNSLGACLAAAAGNVAKAAWLVALTRREITYQLGKWGRIVLLGVVLMPLSLLARDRVWAVGLLIVTTALYVGALFALHILSWSELRQVWCALWSEAPVPCQESP